MFRRSIDLMAEGIRILHVDDESAFSALTSDTLEDLDDTLTVETTTDPNTALDIISQESIDCIVADHDMPDQTGIEFLHSVRESHPSLPFILFTGKGSEELATEAIRAGVTDYVQKRPNPEQFELLIKRIRNAVLYHRTEDKLERRESRIDAYRDLLDRALVETDTYLWEWDLERDIVRRYPENQPFDSLSSSEIGDVFDGFLSRVHPDDRESVREAIESGIETETGYFFDCRFQTGHDEWRWIRDYGAVIDDGTKAVGSVTDITKIRKSKDRFHERTLQLADLIDDLEALRFVRDTDGHYIHMNPRYRDRLDCPAETVIGRTPIDLFGDEFGEQLLSADAHVIETGEPIELTQMIPQDERIPDQPIHLHPITDESGAVTMICGIAPTASGFGNEPAASAAFAAGLDLALSGNRTGMWEWNLESGELVWDDTMEELCGFNATNVEMVLENLHPADRSDLEKTIPTIRKTGLIDREVRLYRDGAIHWLHVRGKLLETSDGTGDRMVGIVADIDDQKARERELLDHRQNLERLLEASTELTMAESIDACHEITIGAAVSILGFDWCTIAAPDASEEYFEIRAISEDAPMEIGDRPFGLADGIAGEAFQSGKPSVVNDVLEYLDLEPNETAIRSALSIPIGDRGVFQAAATTTNRFDETDQRHAQLLVTVMQSALERVNQSRELKRQNERLDEFAAVISHDLRNPLTIAQSRLELLARAVQNEHIEPIESAHQRMETMIEDILRTARMGTQQGPTETLSLESLVTECWNYIQTDAASLHIDEDTEIRANRTALAQLLENLLSNAVEHGGASVTITVGSLPTGFYIEDDGVGIDDSVAQSIFDPGVSSTSTGAGFGLTIVEHVVDAHDWDIAVTESDAGGARFEVTGVGSG